MKLNSFDGLTGTEMKIDKVSITIGNKIADGKLSVVYNCSDTRGKEYALKAFGSDDANVFRLMIKKVEIHKSISQHPNIISVFGLSINPQAKTAFELMELCQENLATTMKKMTEVFDDRKIVDIFQSVCAAVHGMHTNRPMIVHQNIKCQNVLQSRGIWKLCDFQLSTQLVFPMTTDLLEAQAIIEKNSKKRVISPEMLSTNYQVSPTIDIWALGCLLFRLCTSRNPFHNNDNSRILNAQYHWPKGQKVDESFKYIVALCLQPDAHKRPPIATLLSELYTKFPEWVDQRWKPIQKLPPQPVQAFVVMQSKDHSTLPSNLPKYSDLSPNDKVSAEPRPFPMVRKGSTTTLNRSARKQHLAGTFDNISLNELGCNTDNSLMSPSRRVKPKLNNSSYTIPIRPNKEHSPENQLLFQRMEKDRTKLSHELLELDQTKFTANLETMRNNVPVIFCHFAFKLLHCSETRVSYVLAAIGELPNSLPNRVWESRMGIFTKFSMIEGNFSIDTMKSQNKDMKIGTPPCCIEAAVALFGHLQIVIVLIDDDNADEYIDEMRHCYQLLTYIINKLKIQRLNVDQLGDIIEKLTNLFESMSVHAQGHGSFPALPYNFDDKESTKDIRSPPRFKYQVK